MADSTTSGLSAERLARLLAVGAGGPASPPGDAPAGTAAEVLRAALSGPTPTDPAREDAAAAVLGRPCEELAPLAGRSVASALLDPAADAAAIVTLKDYYKAMSVRRRDGARRGAAVALYYAAIAAALVLHDRKITSHPYAALDRALAALLGKPWLAPELADLFTRARAVCAAKREQ